MRLSAEMNTSMAGWRARKRASRGISHTEANGWLVETVSGRDFCSRRILATACASSSSTLLAVACRIWPASVRRSSRCRRSNSAKPICSSSVCIWRDSADCVRNSSSAARVNESWRAAASNPLSRSSDGRRRPACGLAKAIFSMLSPHAGRRRRAAVGGVTQQFRRRPSPAGAGDAGLCALCISGGPSARAALIQHHHRSEWLHRADDYRSSIPFRHASHATNSLVRLSGDVDTSVAQARNARGSATGRCMNITHEIGDNDALRFP